MTNLRNESVVDREDPPFAIDVDVELRVVNRNSLVDLATNTTLAPALPRAKAIALPMPLLAPVTIAVCCSSFIIDQIPSGTVR